MERRADRPTFIIGGAPRSGTTFLCHVLDRHPQVWMAKPYIPEPKVLIGPTRTVDAWRTRYAELFETAGDRPARGEKTSTYFESDTVPGRVREVCRDARMIFLLREPVARAYSNYLFTRANGLEPLPFADAVRQEGRRASPLPPDSAHARPYDYMWRARYDEFAARWLETVGAAAVGFWLYEDLVAEPERVTAEIHRFIGVEPRPADARTVGRVNSARQSGDALPPELAARLRRPLKAMVARLARLTGLDLSPWGYAAVPDD